MSEEDIFAGAFGDEEAAPEAQPEPQPEPAPEPEPASGPQPEPEPAPQPEPAPEPKPEIPAGHVPLSAVLDEREKRRALEQQLQELRAAQPQPEQPDPYLDPESYHAQQQEIVQQRLLDHTLNTSERFARKEHGAETVDQAKAWALERFNTDPLYRQKVLTDPDPYELVVTEWKREQVFAQLQPGQLDAFLAWRAAQDTAQPSPNTPQAIAPAAPATPPPKLPTPSLAAAPSAGGLSTQGLEDPFDAEFKSKKG